MALVSSEMGTDIKIAGSVSSCLIEIKPHFTLRLKEQPRPPYTHRDFGRLWLDLPELRGYFPLSGTLNLPVRALLFSEMDTGKTITRSVSTF